jgi:hypothetical protein
MGLVQKNQTHFRLLHSAVFRLGQNQICTPNPTFLSGKAVPP